VTLGTSTFIVTDQKSDVFVTDIKPRATLPGNFMKSDICFFTMQRKTLGMLKQKGFFLFQTALRYNIHLPEGAFGFSLSVRISNASCPLDQPAKFDIVLVSR